MGCLHSERMDVMVCLTACSSFFLSNPDPGTRANILSRCSEAFARLSPLLVMMVGHVLLLPEKAEHIHVTSARTIEATEPHVPCTVARCKQELHTHVLAYYPIPHRLAGFPYGKSM